MLAFWLLACADPPVALVMAIPADPGGSNASRPGDEVRAAMSAPLIRVEPGCPPTLSPGLVKVWSASPDGKTLHWTLSSDYAWSDGPAIIVDDLQLAWEMSPKLGNRPDGMAGATLIVDDPTHVRWTFPTPGPALERQLAAASVGVLPKHAFDADPVAVADVRDAPTSGPWRLSRWDGHERIVLEPNPGWPGPSPAIRQLEFRVIPDAAQRVVELRERRVDVVDAVPFGALADLSASHPEIALHPRDLGQVSLVVWNTRRFPDPAMRRAFSAAIDVDRLVAAGGGHLRRAVGTVPASRCQSVADDIAPIHADKERAKASLSALGWLDHDADGLLDKDGQKLAFELLVTRATQADGDAVAADLRAIGVDVRAAGTDGHGRLDRGEFDAAVVSLEIGPRGGPLPWLAWSGYRDAGVDAAMERASTDPDPKQAGEAWREVQRRIHADQPATFLTWTDEIVAIHRRFGGVRADGERVLRGVETWSVGPP